MVRNRYLFNFSASWGGGGLKRLTEYAKWFNANGGAWFIIHMRCNGLTKEVSNNAFFIVNPSRLERLVRDCAYLDPIRSAIGRPDLYYSYGIPMYSRVGRLNWFHISNVLPLAPERAPLNFLDRMKFRQLGRRIQATMANADVVSAESRSSLAMLPYTLQGRLHLSVNGSDDELNMVHEGHNLPKDSIATVVGTYPHKAVSESYQVFKELSRGNPGMRLVIIGGENGVPSPIRHDRRVLLTGVIPRHEVVGWLSRTQVYISTSLIENSYNAASEGVFLAAESYISDIGPHRELFAGARCTTVDVPGVSTQLLYARREWLSMKHLKTWDNVIRAMNDEIGLRLSGLSDADLRRSCTTSEEDCQPGG